MAKRVLLCLSHSIEEHDQLKLLAGLGYEVASIGGYIDPANPHDQKRPALDIPFYPELKEAIDSQNVDDNLGAAQAYIPDAILDWLGADGIIIYHHYLERLFGQWNHLFDWMAGGGRVIWRTVGQSTEDNERRAQQFRNSGLEIIRYSPKEMNIPGFAGEDKLIRFYKDPLEWMGWTGEIPVVCNITQHLAQRHPWTNAMFFAEASGGLPTVVAGPGSEALPIGIGELEFSVMKELLQTSRAYLYTGTQPASYTLGLLEALMTGVPVFSIGPSHMKIFAYGQDLYEGHELSSGWSDDPLILRDALAGVLADGELAQEISIKQRTRTIAEFGIDRVGADWKAYLG